MGVLAVGLRLQRRRASAGLPATRLTGRRDRGWPALIAHVLTDALAGYLVLAAVVVLYYYGVARVGSNFLDSEFTGTALLLGISLPLFLGLSWLTQRGRAPAWPGAAVRRDPAASAARGSARTARPRLTADSGSSGIQRRDARRECRAYTGAFPLRV